MKAADDLVILGGGCAGLSLAMRLAKLGEQCPQTIIVEPRERYVNDRTWGFWGTPSAQLNPLVPSMTNEPVGMTVFRFASTLKGMMIAPRCKR